MGTQTLFKYMNVVLAVLAILPTAYFFYLIRRLFKTLRFDVNSKKILVITTIISIVIWHFCTHVTGTIALFLFSILTIEMVVHIFDLIFTNILTKSGHLQVLTVWKTIFGSLLIPVTVTVVMFICGYFNIRNVVETHYTVETDKTLPSDYRICFLADVHCGNVLKTEDYFRIAEEINSKNIDLLIIGGDLVDYNTKQDVAEKMMEAFSTIKTKDGMYFVFGNHDRVGDYKESLFTEQYIIELCEKNGIRVLQDEYIDFDNGVSIVGREDKDTKYGRYRKSAEQVFDGVDTEKFVIVADHQPSDYKVLAQLGADLILGGHIHAGQIFPANLLIKLTNPEHVISGRYLVSAKKNKKAKPDGPCKLQDGTATAIVSSGFVGWSYPVRTVAHSEYCIIDIQSERSQTCQ